MIWASSIVEGYAKDLADALDLYTKDGWTVFAVLTNGINRWTVIVNKAAG